MAEKKTMTDDEMLDLAKEFAQRLREKSEEEFQTYQVLRIVATLVWQNINVDLRK